MVNSNTENIKSRPLKSSLANANAANIVVVTVPNMVMTPTLTVFQMYVPKLNLVIANLKLTHCISPSPTTNLGFNASVNSVFVF